MSQLQSIFNRIEKLIHPEGHSEFISVFKDITINDNQFISNEAYKALKSFLQKIFCTIDELVTEIKSDDSVLISVKNQKLLRTCFQLITSLGISPCLIPGLGINISKKCATGAVLPMYNDEQKYEILTDCTNFFTRSYSISVLKTIIITLHLSDYLAALIQLSFAPFKKPGNYKKFTMTQEMYDRLTVDRKKFVSVYNELVANCFQPMLMRELLVLQSGKDPVPPAFAKRVIAKELSQRLLAPGGLLSLIRCFIESYNIDTGFEWKKIDMICRIIAATHGSSSEDEYLSNICSQLQHILSLNNTHYLTAAVACVIILYEKYPQSTSVASLVNEVFQSFNYDFIKSNYHFPGTIVLSSQEVEHKLNVLHACVCTAKLDCPIQHLIPNLYLIYLIGIKCTKNEELKIKLKDILLKSLEKLRKEELCNMVKIFLFGKDISNSSGIQVEEFEAGVTVKLIANSEDYNKDEALAFFVYLFNSAGDALVTNIFEVSLKILIEVNVKRKNKANRDMLLTEDDPLLTNEDDQQYAIILQLLSEITTSLKIINSLRTNPMMVTDFIQHFILKEESDNECITIALVLLNTILSNSDKPRDLEMRFKTLIPVLRKMGKNELSLNSTLCNEALQLITLDGPLKKETACEKAIADVFDELLPVRAHGTIELTKLIEAGDAETISKKHYIFCIFQKQLNSADSYIYLSAVNGLASLCSHCTEDVLHILCKEFLQEQSTTEQRNIETKDSQNRASELRMKIGDVIVKVTKRLGEMAVVYKNVLLNTMLCGCRDEDPLIRTSALSNLAEIALVLNYRMGNIIYEVLICIWSIIETDKAIECRRAAVMVISSLIKGLGKDTLIELKENLLPIYRTLKNLYRDNNEDKIVRLHAQIALEELNDAVNQFLIPELKMEKQIFVLDQPTDVFKKTS